jgi:hypothetical protein
LLEAAAVGGADQVDAVLASVVAECLAEKERPVRGGESARVEELRILGADIAVAPVVRVDDSREPGRRAAGSDVRTV